MATSKSAFLKQAKKDLPRVNTSDLVELAAAIEKELKIRARLGMRGLVVKDKATKAAEEKARINRELNEYYAAADRQLARLVKSKKGVVS